MNEIAHKWFFTLTTLTTLTKLVTTRAVHGQGNAYFFYITLTTLTTLTALPLMCFSLVRVKTFGQGNWSGLRFKKTRMVTGLVRVVMVVMVVFARENAQHANESTAPTAGDESERESVEERAGIMEYDGHMTRDEAEEAARALMAATTAQGEPQDAIEGEPYPIPGPGFRPAGTQAGAHPCPPLPSSYRWQGVGPLHRLRAEPDDSRRRCAYCAHFHPITRHGRLKPWCAQFEEWRDPGILHQCDDFSFEAGAIGRWL